MLKIHNVKGSLFIFSMGVRRDPFEHGGRDFGSFAIMLRTVVAVACACLTMMLGFTDAKSLRHDFRHRCRHPTKPFHGSVSAGSLEPGGTATYSCDKGYHMVGSSTRTCGSTGMWSNAAPTCRVTYLRSRDNTFGDGKPYILASN